MGSVLRKDYGLLGVLPENNPTAKELNALNSPHSIQAMGLKTDTPPQDYVTDYNTITVGLRVLYGNFEGVVASVTKPASTVNAITVRIVYPGDNPASPVIKSYTRAEIESTNDFFIQKSIYVPQAAV
jgi:hypothetical protein